MADEYEVVTSALNSFHNFFKWQYQQVVKPKAIKFKSLSQDDQELLPWYPKLVSDLGQCVDINKAFTQHLAEVAAKDWGIPADPSGWAQCQSSDYDKVRSTLLQFGREWSTEGREERRETFGRLVSKACELFPEEKRAATKVLVPGCGLGRLVFDFVECGFWTQGNEVSYHMLLASGFLLNSVSLADSQTIFPYIHTSSHVSRRLYQLRPVTVPDKSPFSIFNDDGEHNSKVQQLMSMAAGSFVDLYGPPGLSETEAYTQDATAVEFRSENHEHFDVVATCFFLDTAHNILDYLKTISHCLKKGGYWLNVGPLHWHFEGDQTSHMVKKASKEGKDAEYVQTTMEGLELTREELLGLIQQHGFVIRSLESGIKTSYSSDVRALSKFVYDCEFWVAQKVA